MKIVFVLIGLIFLAACSHGHHKRKYKHHWEKMDVNQDGKLSREEFMSAHTKAFDLMDANKDGFVTMEEKKTFYKKKRLSR